MNRLPYALGLIAAWVGLMLSARDGDVLWTIANSAIFIGIAILAAGDSR